MLRITSRLLGAVAVATVAVVGFTTSPALAVDTGHIDALDVDLSGGTVTLDIKTYSPANDDVTPSPTGDGLIWLHPLSLYDLVVTQTSGSWPCIDGLNQTAYVAPAEMPADGRVWPGWNTDDVAVGNRPVTIELISVTDFNNNPAPGHVTLYNMVGLPAAPSVLLSTATGCTDSSHSIASGSSHGHTNWAFSEPGNYKVTFKATVTGGATSGNVPYYFTISN